MVGEESLVSLVDKPRPLLELEVLALEESGVDTCTDNQRVREGENGGEEEGGRGGEREVTGRERRGERGEGEREGEREGRGGEEEGGRGGRERRGEERGREGRERGRGGEEGGFTHTTF